MWVVLEYFLYNKIILPDDWKHEALSCKSQLLFFQLLVYIETDRQIESTQQEINLTRKSIVENVFIDYIYYKILLQLSNLQIFFF